MPSFQPLIVGFDAVSPLGLDWTEQWLRALDRSSGIGPLTRFPMDDRFPVRIAGQVDQRDLVPCPPFLRPRELAHWSSPVFKYAMLVVNRALARAKLAITPEISPRVAVTFSTAIGGLDAVLAADRTMIKSGSLPMPYMNPNSCINMVGGKISAFTGATGPVVTTVTACATGSTSMAIGAMFLEQGLADIAICGAVDFPLVEPIVAGFATMNGAYRAKDNALDESPTRASRPMSLTRRGFVVSEGAGCLVLASPQFARAHGLHASAALAGWAMNADAYHPVAPNRATAARCIAMAIDSAGIKPSEIDAINAHAASTKIGDKTEFDALSDVFGLRLPPLTANKSLFGHAMGASSAIESIFALESMREGLLLPTINHEPDPEIPVDCVADGPRKHDQRFVLKNAFGFGGANTCLVFRRLD